MMVRNAAPIVVAALAALAALSACGTADETVPVADDVAPSAAATTTEPAGIDVPTTTGAPQPDDATVPPPTTGAPEPDAAASSTAAPSTPDGPPPSAAPCITSGVSTIGMAAEVDTPEAPAIAEEGAEEAMTSSEPAPTVAPDPSLTDPESLSWLAPVAPPCGLQLVEARRELAGPCGPGDDCALTMPRATIRYESDDPDLVRTVTFVQQLGTAATGPVVDGPGEQRQIAGRDVTLHQLDGGGVTAIWAEELGTVTATGFAITEDDLAGFIGSLTPYEPDEWPGDVVVEPAPKCVDDTTRYAPTALPDGWERFVLDIAPNGACDVAPYLFMSLVIPGTEAAPGTLVTFVIGPGGGPLPEGDVSTVMVGDVEATLSQQTDAVGQPANTIVFRLGGVTIDAHGNADADTLVELAESVELVDVATWEQLAAEVASG